MALYEFHCVECGNRFEIMRDMREHGQPVPCPRCDAQASLAPSVFASSDQSSLRVPARAALRSEEAMAGAGSAEAAAIGMPGETPRPAILSEAEAGSMHLERDWPKLLTRIDLFHGLMEDQRKRLAELGELVTMPQRERIARRGEHGGHLFAILEGQVELSAPSAGKELTVRIAGPGESFPLACLLGEGQLVTTARAMSDVRLVRWDRERLLELFADRTDISALVYERIAEIAMDRYRSTIDRLSGTVAAALSSAGFWANV